MNEKEREASEAHVISTSCGFEYEGAERASENRIEHEARQLRMDRTSVNGGRYGATGRQLKHANPTCSQNTGSRAASPVLQQIKEATDLQHHRPSLTGGTDDTGGNPSLYQQVKESLLEEMHEADNMKTIVFDMHTTQALSLLPKDMINAARAPSFYSDVSDNEEHDALLVDDSTAHDLEEHNDVVPVHAYTLLVSEVAALSTIGPFLELLDGVHPALKLYWRLTAASLALLPVAIWTVRSDGFPRLRASQWGSLMLTGACYSTFLGAYVVSLNYTSVGNATIFSNSHSLLLLAGKVFLGEHVMFVEGMGGMVAFGGAVLCAVDSTGVRSSDDTGSLNYLSTVYGDFLAVLSAIGAVGYFVFAKTIRHHVSIYIFMFLNLFVSSQLVLLFILVTGVDFTWDRNADHGMFGWTNTSWGRLGVQIAMTLIPDLFGAVGYIRSMRYFDTLVISVATLGEPVAAELTAVLFGVGVLPGLLGWMGNLLVAGGTYAVIYPSSSAHAQKRLNQDNEERC